MKISGWPDCESKYAPREVDHKMTKVLMELTPCFDGHAGIPQDTRITFDILSRVPGVDLGGLLLDNGAGATGFRAAMEGSTDEVLNSVSRYIVAIENPDIAFASGDMPFWRRLIGGGRVATHVLKNYLGQDRQVFPLATATFSDYLWQRLFSKSLPVDAQTRVLGSDFYGCSISAHQMHACAAMRLPDLRFDTREFDTVITQKPFNARVSSNTRLLVRYHDAIPITHPHTIADSRLHQKVHYRGLRSNVRNGAEFVCNSHTTRASLVTLFPELENRAHVVHCAVTDAFHPDGDMDLNQILVQRTNYDLVDGLGSGKGISEFSGFLKSRVTPEYFISVGTMEPRKNYSVLISAWERYRSETGKDVKLVLVANPGWSSEQTLLRLKQHMLSGNAYVLANVPLFELRKLYTNARALIVASVSEGFSYSGIEAMKCGTQVIASDIPCHREVYGSDVHYFNPYATEELTATMLKLDDVDGAEALQMVESNLTFAQRYSTDSIGHQWSQLLDDLG